VLGAQVHERQQIDARDFLDIALVPLRNAVSESVGPEGGKEGKAKECQKSVSMPRVSRPRPSLSRRSIHG
jgi:hypothetical protein